MSSVKVGNINILNSVAELELRRTYLEHLGIIKRLEAENKQLQKENESVLRQNSELKELQDQNRETFSQLKQNYVYLKKLYDDKEEELTETVNKRVINTIYIYIYIEILRRKTQLNENRFKKVTTKIIYVPEFH